MSTAPSSRAQASLGAQFAWASACPDTLDAAGVAALSFHDLADVFDGDRPRLRANAEKRDTYGGPLYFAAGEEIDVTEIRLPRAEGATPADFDAAQTALQTAAQARAHGTLKITVPTSAGVRSEAYVCQVLSFHEELDGPAGLQTVVVRLQGQKLAGQAGLGTVSYTHLTLPTTSRV